LSFKSPKNSSRSPFSQKLGFSKSLPDLTEANHDPYAESELDAADGNKGLEDILGMLDGKPKRESVGGIRLLGDGSKNQARLM
jgi:hypothetical protein